MTKTSARKQPATQPSCVRKKIDPSIYSECFLGMAKSAKGWCQTCQSLDHSSDSWLAGSSTSASRKWPASRQQGDSANKPTCLKINKNDRECLFGARCCYVHLLTMTKQLRHDCSAIRIMIWPGTIGKATRIFKLLWATVNCLWKFPLQGGFLLGQGCSQRTMSIMNRASFNQ